MRVEKKNSREFKKGRMIQGEKLEAEKVRLDMRE